MFKFFYEMDYSEKVKENRLDDLDDEINDLLDTFGDLDSLELRYNELVKEYMKEPYALVDNAKENFDFVMQKCIDFAKENHLYIRAEINKEYCTATIVLKSRALRLNKSDIDIFSEIAPRIKGVTVFFSGKELNIYFSVIYFAHNGTSPSLKAWGKMIEES